MAVFDIIQGAISPIRHTVKRKIFANMMPDITFGELVEETDDMVKINTRPFDIGAAMKLLGSKSKVNALFTVFSWYGGVSFRKFFTFEFIKMLEAVKYGNFRYGINMDVVDKCLEYFKPDENQIVEIHDIDRKRIRDLFNVEILDHQETIIRSYLKFKYIQKYRGMLMHASAGTGKALVNGTPVRILDGWKKIEDLKVGDKVIGDDGKETNVIGVHPQGKRHCFKITFTDGRMIVADENHLWKVFKKERSVTVDHEANWKIVDTKYLYDCYIKKGFNHSSNRFYIPLPESEIKPDKNYVIDPYILGCILGDGGISVNGVTITTSSLEVIKRIETKLHHDIKLKYSKDPTANCYNLRLSGKTNYNHNVYLTELRRLNLYGCVSYTKFIPEEYLNGSTEQRWELLRGLMDTDGTVSDPEKTIGRTGKKSKCGNISYSTSSYQLCLNVIELIRSLGGMAKYYIKIPYYTHLGERKQGKDNYVINVRLKHPNMAFTRPDRKSRLTYENQYTRGFKLLIRSIDYIGKYETTCISVDNESKLFVAKDYIVTHNSLSALFIMEGMHIEVDKVLIICPLPTVNDVWRKTLGAEGAGFKKAQDYWWVGDTKPYDGQKYIICHYEGLEKLQSIFNKFPKGKTGVIIDESHNLNDPKSKRTQLAIDFVNKVESSNVLLLSGTPLKSGFREMGLLFKLLDNHFDSHTEKRYITLYSSPSQFMSEVLRERYDGYAVKVSKDAIKLDPLNTVNLKVTIPESEMKQYYLSNIKEDLKEYVSKRSKELKEQEPYWTERYLTLREQAIQNGKLKGRDLEDYIRDVDRIRKTKSVSFGQLADVIERVNKYEKNYLIPNLITSEDKKIFKEAKTIYKYPVLKVQGEALANVIGKARIRCHIALAEYLDLTNIINSSRKKTIIFSNYVDVCKAAEQICTNLGYNPICVFGEETKNLASNVDKFLNSKNINPLITTYKSLSTGVPLVAADTIICLDMPFRMYIYEQAVARAWRLGQDSQVTSYIIEANTDVPNINSRNLDIITWYKEEVERITGVSSSVDIKGDSETIGFEEGEFNGDVSQFRRGLGLEELDLSTEGFFDIFRTKTEEISIDFKIPDKLLRKYPDDVDLTLKEALDICNGADGDWDENFFGLLFGSDSDPTWVIETELPMKATGSQYGIDTLWNLLNNSNRLLDKLITAIKTNKVVKVDPYDVSKDYITRNISFKKPEDVLTIYSNDPEEPKKFVEYIKSYDSDYQKKLKGEVFKMFNVIKRKREELAKVLDKYINTNVTTEDIAISIEAPNPKRKTVEDFIIKYIGKIVTGDQNVNLYREMFKRMNDKDFDQFMIDLRDGKKHLTIIIPNGMKEIKTDLQNNMKIAKELGFEFYQRLQITGSKTMPDYITPNKYLVVKLPVKRASQLLSKKISIPKDNKSRDLLTGQVTGDSRAAKLTNPEVQILLGLGLESSIKELMKFRGGDLGAGTALNNDLMRYGRGSQANSANMSTGVVSTKTLKQFFQAMHIRSTL